MSRPAFTLLLLLLAALLVPFVTASSRPADKLPSGKRAAAPQPSRRMGVSRGTSSKGSSKAAGKRKPHELKQAGPVSRKDFSSFLCPDGATACPVPAPGSDRSTATESDLHQITTWLASGFECIPTDEELNSCGGCLSLGQGFVTHLLSYCRREPWMSSSELTSALALDPGPLAGKIARRSRIRATSRATGARASSSAARRASSSASMARPAFGRLQPARATSRRRPCAVSTRSPLRPSRASSEPASRSIALQRVHHLLSFLRHLHLSLSEALSLKSSLPQLPQAIVRRFNSMCPFEPPRPPSLRHLAPLWTISSICSFRDRFLHLTVIPTPEHTHVPSSSET
jgi:hypothetical protein